MKIGTYRLCLCYLVCKLIAILADDLTFCYLEDDGIVCGGSETLRLTRINGHEVGAERVVDPDGKRLTMKTLSLNPLILEIPNFLSSEECDHFISVAKKQGLVNSSTGVNGAQQQMRLLDTDGDGVLTIHEMRLTIENGFDVYPDDDDILQMYIDTDLDTNRDGNITKDEMKNLSPRDMKRYIKKFIEVNPEKHSRYSQQVWMYPDQSTDKTFIDIQNRVSEVVNLPLDVIRLSNFQVVRYGPHGHYNAHFDSARLSTEVPCCRRFDSRPCRVCRYMTILFYLNDVTEGGETAFVLAGNDSLTAEEAKLSPKINLYRNCSESALHIKPERGKVIVWYNHYIDQQTGWMGEMDDRTLHGGCPVVTGEKWIGNFWVRVLDTKEEDLERIREINKKLNKIKTEL
ncbi:hypothetical protein LOTGIDRAFT_157676 [Lottia gigantea]|uniref:Fe2OG dioxygenase domain-containing protein n=1 Tax=Lottia gigantea TaxID=225164 RepID=V4A937_LOTGI|nr:hypothetical protein LOTGIDRAFT_157676 [Lottia gigantea]ESP00469.1 hypothetical protein LOTGIDRAFT_157676 [Lottia gigantea]